MKLNCRIKGKLPRIKNKAWYLIRLINRVGIKKQMYRYAGRSIFVSMDIGGNDIGVISARIR
jgi:hypothetical protein